MPKNNKSKGGKSYKSSNQLLIKNDDNFEYYAEVLKSIGHCQFIIRFLNSDESIGKLKGSMTNGRGFEKVVSGNWVLVQKDPTTTGKDKYFIIHKYGDSDKKQLEKLGELVTVSEIVDKSTYIFEGDEETVERTEEKIDDIFINDI
jgi:hypothetical protein